MNKKCFKCGKEKLLEAFYRHPRMADGRLGKCKECTKGDVSKNRTDNIDYYRAYDRERADLPYRIKQRAIIAERWRKDPELRKRSAKMKKEWQDRNAIKRAAHIITYNAIRAGKLIKEPCEVCRNKKSEAHHDDYTKPLKVRWLCRKHHMEHHKNAR